jgi:putative membrane fusion protein
MNPVSEKDTTQKTTATLKIIWVLLGLFFVAMVISQFYIHFYNPLVIETAMLYNTSEDITFKGVHIRNERLVRYGGADVISYIHPDGSKLGRNSVVAQSYIIMDDILIQRRIDKLTERVNLLESAQTLISTDTSQLESYISQITTRHTALLGQIGTGDYSALESHKSEYISLQSKRRILMGEETDYRTQIIQMNSEIVSLRAAMSAQPRNVTIDDAGYFVSVADGYEGLLNFDKLPAITREEIENIIRNPMLDVADDIIGKMIDGYNWRFVGILSTERTSSLHEGMAVEFRTGGSTQTVKATILRQIRLDDGMSIYIFECDILTPEFASRRISQFSLLLDSFRGIRIPRRAVHVIDGEQGVFVQRGAELVFRKIDVIVREVDYFLVEDTTDRAGYISLYDSVVVSGRDLYEGKIVQ